MRVIFVGDKFKLGGLVEHIKANEKNEVGFINANFTIKKQENEILEKCHEKADYIIYDTEQYLDDAEDVVDTIKRIYRATKAKPILYVPTDNPKNSLVKYAVSQDIKSFVNSSESMGVQKDQFLKTLMNYYEANKRDDIKAIEEEVKDETVTLNRFVGELYEAKEREIKKEKTIIVKKKKTSEIIISTIKSIVRTIAYLLSIVLISVGVLSLLYPASRKEILIVLKNTYKEILRLLM